MEIKSQPAVGQCCNGLSGCGIAVNELVHGGRGWEGRVGCAGNVSARLLHFDKRQSVAVPSLPGPSPST